MSLVKTLVSEEFAVKIVLGGILVFVAGTIANDALQKNYPQLYNL